MGYQPISPFQRTLNAALIEHASSFTPPNPAAARPAPQSIDKWTLLREAGVARKALGITDRNLTVLQALLSCSQGPLLSDDDRNGLVVHPSNATLSARLNGMPQSTLRRHLAALVDAGLILRRDSPNGKRYVRRHRDGDRDVYGFDLSPLLHRAQEIATLAEDVRTEEDRISRLRLSISLMRRDLEALVIYGRTTHSDWPHWDELADLSTLSGRVLRRQPDPTTLTLTKDRLKTALTRARNLLEPTEMDASDAHFERHHQNSDKDLSESEEPSSANELQRLVDDPPTDKQAQKKDHDVHSGGPVDQTTLPLRLVLTACRDIQSFAAGPVRHWHEFHDLAAKVRPMMGISSSAWDDAVRTMGHCSAAVALACILERFASIRSPGGYLRALTAKALGGTFSCGPMVAALLR